MSEWDFEWICRECGENEMLSPVSGLCYDCDIAAGLDDDDDDGEEMESEEEVCLECGQAYPPEALEDGVCVLCIDEEE